MEIHDTARLRSVYDYLSPDRRGQAGAARTFSIPSPLALAAWSKLVPEGGADLFGAAMRDRRARRVLYGVAALDAETRAYFEANPALVEKIFRNHSDVFAPYGRSFHVRNGRVEVPGGASAAELWEHVVRASVAAPDVFFDRLLAADTGELAALYDTVAHLDAAHQRFMLGTWMTDPQQRRARFATLHRAARDAGRRVAIPHQPFVRTAPDLLAVISHLHVLDDGRLAPPASPAFWGQIFARDDHWQDVDWSPPPAGKDVDATWFVESAFLSAASISEQSATISFAQRLYASASGSPGATVDERSIQLAVGAFRRFPSLAVALERAGIRTPATYVAAFNRAGTLTRRGNPFWHRQLLAQFQGGVALVEQLRLNERLSVPNAERLITQLAAAEPNSERLYAGAVARWLAEQVLPALSGESVGDADAVLLSALAGAPRDRDSLPRLTWEDWEYRLEPSLVPMGRLQKVRALQAGNTLDVVLRVWRAASVVSAARAGAAGPASDAALAELRRASESLRALAGVVREPAQPTDGSRRDGADVRTTLKEVVTGLDAVRETSQLSRAVDLGRRLMRAVDLVTADLLTSVLYAIQIRDTASPLLLQGDVAHRHDFGLMNRDGLDPDRLSWSFPAEQFGDAWHVRGSLLGLDVALARLRLPQVAAGGPPAPPVMAPEDQRVFIESVALFDRSSVDDDAMREVGDSIRTGRERVRAAARDAQALDRLAAAGRVGEWRRNYVLPWLTAQQPDAVLNTFSLSELYRIGTSGRLSPAAGIDVWGGTTFPLNGCQCLRMPSSLAWEDVSGRIGAVPPVIPDGTLRLAELMSELRLPARLARHILPVLMREMLDRVQMVYSDDWTAVARYWTTISRDRIQDAMGALTVDGPLLASSGDAGTR